MCTDIPLPSYIPFFIYFTDDSTSQDRDHSLSATTVSLQSSCKSTSTSIYLVLSISALYKSTSSHPQAFVS